MKKIVLLFMVGLLSFNVASAQSFTSIVTDAMNDGSDPNLLDGTELEYSYDPVSDSITFRVSVANLSSNISAFGVNIMVNVPGPVSATFNFWGTDNMNPFHRLLTVWVTGTPPSAYTGTIGISDAPGVNAANYTSVSSNNIGIEASSSTNRITLKVKRSDLIPDFFFTTNTVTCVTAAAVGSDQFWNDDIYSSSGTMTITKSTPSSIHDIKNAAWTFSMYPNPVNDMLHIGMKKQLKDAEVAVYDLFGQKIISDKFSGTEHLMDISNLSKGIYVLSIRKDAEVVSKQLIKR